MNQWKPEFKIDGIWYGNGERYDTESEANDSARSRFSQWSQPTDYRATKVEA